MKSMTGFAQGRFDFNEFSFSVSIKSLNHKFLDLNFKGTGITPNSEKLIKEIIKDRVHRGKVDIVFNLFERDPLKWNIQFNEFLLDEILEKMAPFNRRHKFPINLSLDSLMKIPMIFHLDYEFEKISPASLDLIRTSISQVCDDFVVSRAEEGEFIQASILDSLQRVRQYLEEIEAEADQAENLVFSNLQEKIRRFVKEYELDERRIAQEAALSAEKSCIREEIQRLETHTQRLQALVKNPEPWVKGREADFLSQEMLRETHTIASKTASLDIHHMILMVRREIEKIRQQVQNVE
ncbi:MAG TPA: DUF1732 domain-containing protein [Candidatus Aminicenantes bacterium]|nr:DUF1732 domain-containing protein [Candidatus Aminicenantes bacterium]